MTLLLRKQHAQDRIEGREPFEWPDDDYAIVDETRAGRMYTQRIHGEMKWLWFLQTAPRRLRIARWRTGSMERRRPSRSGTEEVNKAR
jgi:hypothetical protein